MYRAVEVVPVCSQLLWGAPPGNDFRAALLSHVRGLLQQEGFPFPVVPEISSKVRIMMQNPRPGPGSRQPRKSEFGFGPGGALWWRAMPLRLRSASFRPAPVFQRLGLRDQSRKVSELSLCLEVVERVAHYLPPHVVWKAQDADHWKEVPRRLRCINTTTVTVGPVR